MHMFLYMRAHYADWKGREAWRELMFADTDSQAKAARDATARTQRLKAAPAKAVYRIFSRRLAGLLARSCGKAP